MSSPGERPATEWEGAFCPVQAAAERVITTARDWEALWKELGQPTPAADFSTHFAVAVFLGLRSSGGYGIQFEPPDGAIVRYQVKTPGGFSSAVMTQPYAVRLFVKTAGTIRLEARND